VATTDRIELQPGEFEKALEQVRRQRRAGRQRIELSSPAEVLKAVELGVINKTEARAMFGLRKRRGVIRKVPK
jgi:hypothetical protein